MFKPIIGVTPGNRYYTGTAYGGLNRCIVIDKDTGWCLPNCTGFAYGAWLESTQTETCNLPTGDAGNWYRLVGDNYERGGKPKLGAIACWSGGTNGRGHVALVNEIHADGSIAVAESGYYSKITFTTTTLQYPYSRDGLTLQGFIYNPAVETVKQPLPEGKAVMAYLGQAIIMLGQRPGWKLGMISAAGPDPHTALQKIYQIDSEDAVIYGSMNANYFQMQTDQQDPYGEHYGTEISFTNDFRPHKGNVLAYAEKVGGETVGVPDSLFWYSRDEVEYGCAPAYIPYLHGERVDLWSTAFEGTKANATQQSALIRAGGRYAFAVCSGKLTPGMMTDWVMNTFEDVEDLCFFDSGGSSQIMIGYDTPVYTGREIPNVLAFYEPKTGDSGAIEEPGENLPPEQPTAPEPPQNDEQGTSEPGGGDEMDNNVPKTLLSNQAYDILKWVGLVMLPALASFVLFMGPDLSPNYEVIAKWLTGFGTLLGVLIGASTVQYNSRNGGTDQ